MHDRLQQDLYTPTVSIIIPIYNTSKDLSRCLDSVLSQTYTNIEVICINDGSTDDSLNILTKYQRLDKRILLINQINKGLSEARNAGLKLASGDIVLFIDSDDWIDSTAIETVYKYFEDSRIDFAIFGHRVFYENKNTFSANKIASPNDLFLEDFDKHAVDFNVTAWSKAYRRSFLTNNNILFPPGLLYEDNAFYWECISYTKHILVTNLCFYNYRERSDSIMAKSRNKNSGMSINFLHITDHIYDTWEKNGYIINHSELFRYLIEHYVQLAYLFMNKNDESAFTCELQKLIQKWRILPRKFTIAYDMLHSKKIYKCKYRLANSLRRKIHKFQASLGFNKTFYPSY